MTPGTQMQAPRCYQKTDNEDEDNNDKRANHINGRTESFTVKFCKHLNIYTSYIFSPSDSSSHPHSTCKTVRFGQQVFLCPFHII